MFSVGSRSDLFRKHTHLSGEFDFEFACRGGREGIEKEKCFSELYFGYTPKKLAEGWG